MGRTFAYKGAVRNVDLPRMRLSAGAHNKSCPTTKSSSLFPTLSKLLVDNSGWAVAIERTQAVISVLSR
jgi:hypothetical protein